MEHIFFELQLCIEILIFKEKSNFGYTDHPEITTSLYIYNRCVFFRMCAASVAMEHTGVAAVSFSAFGVFQTQKVMQGRHGS